MKVAWETRKIFEDESLLISCTAVRIPTLRAHAKAVTVELATDVFSSSSESDSAGEEVGKGESLLQKAEAEAKAKEDRGEGGCRSSTGGPQGGLAMIRSELERAKGVDVVDDPEKLLYPMPRTAMKKYNVEVGRLRRNLVFDSGLDLFVCGDQLLRGAALNAVLIAEEVLTRAGIGS